MEQSAEAAPARYRLPNDLALEARCHPLPVARPDGRSCRNRAAHSIAPSARLGPSKLSDEEKTLHPSYRSTNHALYPRSVPQEYPCPEANVREVEKPARR